MMSTFTPRFTITNRMTSAITRIERARVSGACPVLPLLLHSPDLVRYHRRQLLVLVYALTYRVAAR
ncbi:MAG TPA: hypothetical protein DEW46_00185 [Verrucomicrobia bacterium]|nr:hypothetical protein [Verrucomicrobiota bacterium]